MIPFYLLKTNVGKKENVKMYTKLIIIVIIYTYLYIFFILFPRSVG